MIFHGDKGRSSGNKAVEFRNERLCTLLSMVKDKVEVLTFEKFYPCVPPPDAERKWFENLDPSAIKSREEYDHIPSIIFSMTQLKELNFFDCVDPLYKRTYFKRLPSGLTTLNSLKKLTISQCGLEELEMDIGSKNQSIAKVDNIQQSIFLKMTNLEILSVPGNFLTRVPETIGLCSTLKSLRIYNNQIVELPYSLINLNNLEELICTGNKLLRIPLSLTKFCSKLRDLRFLNQNIEDKKLNFTNDKNLSKLKDEEDKCPRKIPFNHTINYSNKFLSTTNRIRLNKCKLMFIGDGAVGKTTTIKALKCAIEKLRLEKEEDLNNVATDGIDMQQLAIPMGFKYTSGHIGGNECVNFSCWDFAGQDVYSYTHQFFLTEKAIYLIGFNIENAVNPDGDPMNMIRVDYWLQSISMRFPSSPIIIFGTHADSKMVTKDQLKTLQKSLNDKYIKNKKLNVVKILFISNFTGKGVKDLLDELKSVCKNRKFAPVLTIDREINLNWCILEERGKSIGSLRVIPILSFDEWIKIAQNDANIQDIEEIKKATQYLHDTGSLIWFNEDGLSDIVCLRADFLADVFAAVISAKSGISTGILKHELLLHIWKGFPSYLYPYMIALLEKFEITHRLEGDAINNTAISSALLTSCKIENIKLPAQEELNLELFQGRSIVPSLLPTAPPSEAELESIWPKISNEYSEIERLYQFDFIPNGFFSRLMVRLLHSNWNAEILWRYGIIARKEMSYVYLSYNQDTKEINLKLRTRSEHYRLGPLLESMNALIDDWLKNSDIKILIPVKLENKLVNIEIKAIEKAASNGASHIQIEGHEIRLENIAPDLAVIDITGGNIHEDDLQIGSKIGKGGYANVYKGTYNGTPVAIKSLTIKSGEGGSTFSEIFAEFRREVWLMNSLRHENIVELKGVSTKPTLSMVLEMMEGDLYNYIRNNHPLSLQEQLKLALDVAKGIQFMHNSQPPIIHRDLKSPNILIKKVPNEKFPVAKIADFGLSRGLVWSSALDDKAVENPLWLAPEVLKKKPYNEKVDLYAFGVILYELVSGQIIFSEISFMSQVEEKIMKGERPEIPDTIPELKDLISRCWAQDMNDRPNINEVVLILNNIYGDLNPISNIKENKQRTWKVVMPSKMDIN